ncbi:MAG: hypothetical protein ACOX4I_00120 [Anaerovoracaceae bacterium]|jgi:hypothetical protein
MGRKKLTRELAVSMETAVERLECAEDLLKIGSFGMRDRARNEGAYHCILMHDATFRSLGEVIKVDIERTGAKSIAVRVESTGLIRQQMFDLGTNKKRCRQVMEYIENGVPPESAS